MDLNDFNTEHEVYDALREITHFDNFEVLLFGWQHEPSSILISDGAIVHENQTAFLIDPYYGGQPHLINEHFLAGQQIDLAYIPTAALDSNIASLFRRLVFSPDKLTKSDLAIAHGLLKLFKTRGWDYQPIPYYLESAFKNDPKVFYEHALPTAEAIFRLHSADLKVYFETGEFISETGADDYYFKKWNVGSYAEVAKAYLEAQKFRDFIQDYAELLTAISICLKKIVLLDRDRVHSASAKLKILHEYFVETLNAVFAKELMYAAFFFKGEGRTLLRAGKDTSTDVLLKRINSAVWDLFLLRMPEFLIANGSQQETTLMFPCTADKGVALVGQAIKLAAVVRSRSEFNSWRTIVSYNYGLMVAQLGEVYAKEVLDLIDGEQAKRRIDSRRNERSKLSAEELIEEDRRLTALLS